MLKSTILNRSYYTAFLYVKTFIINNNYIIRKPHYYLSRNKKFKTEHQQVIDFLAEKDEELSDKLKKLKRLRHKADYHPNQKITESDVTQAIQSMLDIIKNVQ